MKYLLTLLCSSLLLASCSKPTSTTKTIGLIVPIEHQAMTEIVNGFKQELTKKYHHPISIVVNNAQHDLTLQRSIIQQFIAQNVDVLAPIATDPFEMTVAMAKHQPIVGIAADISEQQHDALIAKGLQVTNVLDEIDIPSQISFVQCAMPALKKITLVHSAGAKFIRQATEVAQAAKARGITVQDLMVQQPSDIYTLSKHIDNNSQAIFILKDSLIVSGIATLVKQADALHIPLISSDDGSVQNGSAFAVGVHERQVGILAADVVAKVLSGKAANDIPMQKMTNYLVFVNSAHAAKQGLRLAPLLSCAKQVGYPIEQQ